MSFPSGLAKPMGLVEGPGGLGQGGAPATLGEDSRDAEGKYEEYGYNAQLSDRISLDRSIPDYRPKKYVHLQFWFLALTLLPLAGLYGFRQCNPLCSWLLIFLRKYTSRGRTLCQESVISVRGSVFSTTMLFAWLLIKGELEMISCSKVLRITWLRKTPHVYSKEHPPPARTGCTKSVRLLDFAASSPAVRDGPALRCPEADDAGNPNWPSTLFKSCIFTFCLQIYSRSTWQRVWWLLLAAE